MLFPFLFVILFQSLLKFLVFLKIVFLLKNEQLIGGFQCAFGLLSCHVRNLNS